MTRKPDQLWDMSAEQAAAHAMDNDLGGSFDQAQVQTRRPAKIVTALRLDLSVQAELEARRGHAESVRQRGCQIIEEWVAAHRDAPAGDQLRELVHQLDAAREAAASLEHCAAGSVRTGRPGGDPQ